MDVQKVAASTQYGMGFLLVTEGAKHLLNGIAYRNDAMSQTERVQLAHDVNQILRQNVQAMAAADEKLPPKGSDVYQPTDQQGR